MKKTIKRFFAFYLDLIYISFIMAIILIFISIFTNNFNNINHFIIALIIGILSGILLCSKDFLFKGTSLGKKNNKYKHL